MPIEILNFIVMFACIALFFIVLNRPLYEAVAVTFFVLLTINGKWASLIKYSLSGAKSSILFTILMFMLFSAVLKKTGVIEDCIDIIMALVGRIPGGVGLVSIVSSAFMGALSGSGPGNVAATGSITIPLMKKTGYPSEVAAGIAMAGSCLSPVIPPSATIITSFACLSVLPQYDNYNVSDFWMVMYSISAIFVLHRIVQMYIMLKAAGIKAAEIENLPNLKEAWHKGWKSFLLIFIILAPFWIDKNCQPLLVNAFGETGASNFSSSILIFTPAVAMLYSLVVGRRRFKASLKGISEIIVQELRPIVSLMMILFFSYSTSALLSDCNTVSVLKDLLLSMHLPLVAMLFLLLMVATVLGMFMAGTALIPLLGPIYILILAAYGVNPVVVAALFPVLFVSLGQMTPPFAVCMYAAMGIAQSSFEKTASQAILWSIGQFLIVFLILLGWLPIPGV